MRSCPSAIVTRMRFAVRVLVVAFLLAGATSCTDQSCNDNYDPTDAQSCSYNPELAGYVEDRDANAGQAAVPEDLGGGYVYLLVSPGEISPEETPTITLVNASEGDVAYGRPFDLRSGDGRPVNLSCIFTLEGLYLSPGSESDAQRLDACLDTPLRPGLYEVSKDIQVNFEAGQGKELAVTATFTVVRE